MPQLQDFQFFQTDRLNEIYEKEQAYELHKHSLAGREAAARAQVHCLLTYRRCLSLPKHFAMPHELYKHFTTGREAAARAKVKCLCMPLQ